MTTPSLDSLKTSLYRYQTLIFAVFVFFMGATFAFFAMRDSDRTSAASIEGFKAGNIISDAVMSNYNSMSVADIQNFLTYKNPCNNTNYDLYLEQSSIYQSVTWHWSGDPYNGHFVCLSEERFGDGTVVGEGQTAAEIIYAAAQEYRINPQVLIVLLEKEQGLISDTYPHSGQYRSATGYGCPDTAACNSAYYGFKNQVFRAAELFRYILDNGSRYYPDNRSGVYVAYNPASSCGRSEVFIENRATAALYQYTPYQPNAAALAAGSGYGDSCSAYGNRNFYLFFTNWFGSTQSAPTIGDSVYLPDSTYTFVSAASSSRALGLSGTNVQLANLNDADNLQRWSTKYDTSTGYYTITNLANGQLLAAADASASSSTNIQTSTSSSCATQWKIQFTSDGYYVFESACTSSQVLSLNNQSFSLGTNAQLATFNSDQTQKWTIHVGRTLEDGIYNLKTDLNTDKDIEVYGGYNYNGANASLWQHTTEESRKWKITYDSATDSYTFINPVTNKALDLYGAVAYNNANVSIYDFNGSCAQRWKIVPRDNGASYNILSACSLAYALDVYGATTTDGSNVALWETHPASSEKWHFELVSQLIADGNYNIVNIADRNAAIDVFGAYTVNGSNVSVWELHSEPSEIWNIQYNSSAGTYTIVNPASGKALDLTDSNTANSSNIQIWSPNNHCAQQWFIVNAGSDAYQFLSACDTSTALDINGGYTTNATNIQIWEANSTTAQKWHFLPRS